MTTIKTWKLQLIELDSSTIFEFMVNDNMLTKQMIFREFYKPIINKNFIIPEIVKLVINGTINGIKLFIYLNVFEVKHELQQEFDFVNNEIDNDDFFTFIDICNKYEIVLNSEYQSTRFVKIMEYFEKIKVDKEFYRMMKLMPIFTVNFDNLYSLTAIKCNNGYFDVKNIFILRKCYFVFEIAEYDLFTGEFIICDKMLIETNHTLFGKLIIYKSRIEGDDYMIQTSYFSTTKKSIVSYPNKIQWSLQPIQKYQYNNKTFWIKSKIDFIMKKTIKTKLYLVENNQIIMKSISFECCCESSNHDISPRHLHRYFYCYDLQHRFCYIDLDDNYLQLHNLVGVNIIETSTISLNRNKYCCFTNFGEFIVGDLDKNTSFTFGFNHRHDTIITYCCFCFSDNSNELIILQCFHEKKIINIFDVEYIDKNRIPLISRFRLLNTENIQVHNIFC